MRISDWSSYVCSSDLLSPNGFWGFGHERDDDHRQDHAQGLGKRPGGPLVSRLRRLCDPQGGAAHHARNRHSARTDGVHQRNRLLVALSLLYGNIRLPHDPWPRPGLCDGTEAREPRSRRVDSDRRRRWAVYRRQSGRKRGVWGKGGAVRVDLCGGRVTKKKKKKK